MLKSYGVIAFRSRQQVLLMERELRSAGFSVRVINTPHEIAIGCGLSVQFNLKDYDGVMGVYNKVRPRALVGFYRVDPQGTQLKCSPLYKRVE